MELAYATQNRLPYASIRNRAGKYVEPSLASTTAAVAGAVRALQRDVRVPIVNAPGEGAYPIAGLTYILVYRSQRDREKGRALGEFLSWAIHEGQRYAPALLYAPLPEELMGINERAIESMR